MHLLSLLAQGRTLLGLAVSLFIYLFWILSLLPPSPWMIPQQKLPPLCPFPGRPRGVHPTFHKLLHSLLLSPRVIIRHFMRKYPDKPVSSCDYPFRSFIPSFHLSLLTCLNFLTYCDLIFTIPSLIFHLLVNTYINLQEYVLSLATICHYFWYLLLPLVSALHPLLSLSTIQTSYSSISGSVCHKNIQRRDNL